jgi:CRISPR-associated endonuclease/helicase Cas3
VGGGEIWQIMTFDFASAFGALTKGKRPFRWQQRLFGQFARGDIPDACDIPTGLGKTSVMAIWLAALEIGDQNVRLPRRFVYVVDRRAIVDQATDEAEQLAEMLGDGTAENTAPVIAKLRERLRLEAGRKLPISTLRGQLADNRAWLEDPFLPAIVVGTVDMIGSRLLFQGYNVSARMRPVHAALLGVDALIVLDEAHLVPPFEALVRNVERLAEEDRNLAPFKVPELRVMTLSATGRGTTQKTFALQPDDEREDEVVCKRLNASKRLKLEAIPASSLAETMAQRAWERRQSGRRVVVFCDSRKVAHTVYDAIEKQLGKHLKAQFGKEPPKSTDFIQLMVGARRVREREELASSKVFKRFSPKTAEDVDAKTAGITAFLVATSAGEVGVDIDADYMVCDLVAWERMVQRLGRVNRLGGFIQSLVDVFAVPSDKDKEAETRADSAQIETWRAPFDSALWPVGQDGRRDASPSALWRLRDKEDFKRLADAATTPEPLRPKLTRALVDAWSMTSVDEHPGRPDVAPWIRGWVDDEPQTRVIWRRHFPIRDDDDQAAAKRVLTDFLDEAPPHLSEILETYTWDVGKLLRDRAKAMLKARRENDDVSRGENAEQLAGTAPLEPRSYAAAILSPGRKVERVLRLSEVVDVEDIRLLGRMVLLDARLGGLDKTGLLNSKESTAPATLDGDSVPSIEQESEGSFWSEERLRTIGFRVRLVQHDAARTDDWRIAYRRFLELGDDETDTSDSALEWRVEDWVGDRPGRNDPALARTPQNIDAHHARTKYWAGKIASRLGLPDGLRDLLAAAGDVHDAGKIRRNWQSFAGNAGFARDSVRHAPLAKFTAMGNPNLLRIGEFTYRHEFGSLRDALERNAFERFAEDLRDYALHAIAAHHGNARPVIAPVDELDPPSVSDKLARQAALRFAHLQKQWGPWGLVWWEALLRAADATASREVGRSDEEAC